jgi:hypothetical protein
VIRYLTKDLEAFDPETVRVLASALDETWEIARADPITYKVDGDPEVARDLLAKHIVDLALQGERDRQRLIDGALERLKL